MLPTFNINKITTATTIPFFQPISGFSNEGYRDFCLNNTRATNTNEHFPDKSGVPIKWYLLISVNRWSRIGFALDLKKKPKQSKTNKKSPWKQT